MKKQILFMMFLSLAFVFAGVSKTFGQYAPQLTAAPTYCPTATPVVAVCGGASHVNPIPGTEYIYEIDIASGDTPGGTIHWFVTDNPALIVDNGANGGDLTTGIEIVPSSNFIQAVGASYNVAANTSPTVAITWKYFTTPVFLVAYVQSTPTCTDNIEAILIEPTHAFTLDIAALSADGVLHPTNEDCVSPIVDAEIVGNELIMDYGINYMYFAVNAANFAHSWKPSFELTVTTSASTVAPTVDWAYPAESHGASAVWQGTTAVAGIYTSTDAVTPVTAGATGVGPDGECIIVRVAIDHDKDETLSDIDVRLAVDGIMYDFVEDDYATASLGDVHDDTGVTDVANCTGQDGYDNDYVDYTLTARPTILEITPAAPAFIPKN